MPKRSIRVTDVIDPRIQCGPSAASISGHMRMPHRRAGAPLEQCDHCSHQAIAYNSCRNRHCPKRQSTARDKVAEGEVC
jgi:hypothetical protein